MALPTIGASGMGAGAFSGGGAAPAAFSGSNIIQGALNFNPGGGGLFSGGLAGLGPAYASAYTSALQANQANYNNILAGYQQTMQNQTSAQDAIARGYADLSNSVLAGIDNIGSAQSQQIKNQYQQASGATAQSMISRGLGNTTIQDSMQAGLTQQEALAQNSLQNQIASTKAGYQSNLGLAGLAYQGQAASANSSLAQNQLAWMNSVNAPYPNAGLYAQLAQQYGATDQANQDRAMQQQALKRVGGFGMAQSGYGLSGGFSSGGGEVSGAFPTSRGGYSIGGAQDLGYAGGSAGSISGNNGYGASLVNNDDYSTYPYEYDNAFMGAAGGPAAVSQGWGGGGNALGAAVGAWAQAGPYDAGGGDSFWDDYEY